MVSLGFNVLWGILPRPLLECLGMGRECCRVANLEHQVGAVREYFRATDRRSGFSGVCDNQSSGPALYYIQQGCERVRILPALALII